MEDYAAWCWLCSRGFDSIDALQKHNQEQKHDHEVILGSERPKVVNK